MIEEHKNRFEAMYQEYINSENKNPSIWGLAHKHFKEADLEKHGVETIAIVYDFVEYARRFDNLQSRKT